MSAESFLDTNLFIYQLEFLNKSKGEIAEKLIVNGIANGTACISFQIIQECLSTIRRESEIPLDEVNTRRYLETVLYPLWKVMPIIRLYERALEIYIRYMYSFYDALIIAPALEVGCTRIYSKDMQHRQHIEGLIIENPFL